jgi:hypothetical protein
MVPGVITYVVALLSPARKLYPSPILKLVNIFLNGFIVTCPGHHAVEQCLGRIGVTFAQERKTVVLVRLPHL